MLEMIRRSQRSSRHGLHALALVTAGFFLYFLIGNPVPLVGTTPIARVGTSAWIQTLPTAIRMATVFAMSWALRLGTRLSLSVLPAAMVTVIELSQGFGPFAGWGTLDPFDLAADLIAVFAVSATIGRRSPSAPRRRSPRPRTVWWESGPC